MNDASVQIVIRRLGSGDEKLAGQLAETFKLSRARNAALSRFLSNPLNFLLVALDCDKPLGFILAYELQRIDGELSKMFLYEIDVAASHQRRGIARALIKELERICKDGAFRSMFVFTNESNFPATELYAATGGHRKNPDDVMFVYDY